MNDVNYLKNNGIDVDAGLEFLADMEDYNDTLKEFVRLSSDRIAKLVTAKITGDLEGYGIIAHSIKGDSRYLGFTKLAEIALEHENQGKANDVEYIDNNFDNFIAEINRMVTISKKYLGNSLDEEENNGATSAKKEKAILVADDSEIIRNFIAKAIENDYDVIMASDGKQVIDIIEGSDGNRIKAMFLDLNMPDFGGFEVLKYFSDHKLFTNYPISIITGADDKESIDKAFTYPIIDMLVKPFTEDDVRRILERTINYK